MTNYNFRPASLITAQVACEGIINCDGDGMDIDTMNSVLEFARSEGVASLYIGGLEEVIDRAVTRRDDCERF